MMADMRENGKQASLVDEVIRLCEGYSIVSEYASFLVLENDAEYALWSIQRRNANRIQKDRSAQRQLRQQLDSMREASLAQLGPTKQQLASNEVSLANNDSTAASSDDSGSACCWRTDWTAARLAARATVALGVARWGNPACFPVL
jgi:hypothetical protein